MVRSHVRVFQPCDPERVTIGQVRVGDTIAQEGDPWWMGTVVRIWEDCPTTGMRRIRLHTHMDLIARTDAPIAVLAHPEDEREPARFTLVPTAASDPTTQ